MRTELKRIHKRDKVTTVYVTHDQAEALVLSDRVTVMNEGEIHQVGDPVEIYGNPTNEFVAEFIGSPSINLINADIAEGKTSIGEDLVFKNIVQAPNGPITLGIRPEDIVLQDSQTDGLKGNIEFTEPQGGVIHAFVKLEHSERYLKNRDYLVVSMDVHESVNIGAAVGIRFREDRTNYFDVKTGQSVETRRQSIVLYRQNYCLKKNGDNNGPQ